MAIYSRFKQKKQRDPLKGRHSRPSTQGPMRDGCTSRSAAWLNSTHVSLAVVDSFEHAVLQVILDRTVCAAPEV
jgi:hypothetical protein